jgi:hypothetical protein
MRTELKAADSASIAVPSIELAGSGPEKCCKETWSSDKGCAFATGKLAHGLTQRWRLSLKLKEPTACPLN